MKITDERILELAHIAEVAITVFPDQKLDYPSCEVGTFCFHQGHVNIRANVLAFARALLIQAGR